MNCWPWYRKVQSEARRRHHTLTLEAFDTIFRTHYVSPMALWLRTGIRPVLDESPTLLPKRGR